MASGGARTKSGPPPDPNALRRDRKSDAGWTVLPVAGRTGAAPEWPLTEWTRREEVLWSSFWSKPQAILWERNAQVFEVALHIRCFAEAEKPDAATSLRTLVRQQADALLLTIPAMLSARVKLSSDDLAEKRQASKPAVRPASSRSRLRRVPDASDAV